MRPAGLLSGALLIVLAGCESASTSPVSSTLSGRWGWQENGNPGGSYMTLTLTVAGNQVTGTGGICGIGPNCNPGSVTVTGTGRPPYGSFAIALRGGGGYLATYSGMVVGADQLQGTWKEGLQTWGVVFNRCTATSFC